MIIFVCVKHVPDSAAKISIQNGTGIDETVKFVTNPYDEYAMEEALLLKEKCGGEVVSVTVGKAAALTTIQAVLAMGADRAIHVQTEGREDHAVTAQALAKAIAKEGNVDLVFMGKQSIDSEGMQTPYRVGKLLGVPVASNVVAFQKIDGAVVVECEMEGGARQVIEMKTPCVVAATKGLNQPRYPKLPDIMKAKKKEVKKYDLASLGVDPAGNKVQLKTLQVPAEKGAGKVWKDGDPRQMVEELVRELHTVARVV
jgi:electron transfer flavoprotein beta subunit